MKATYSPTSTDNGRSNMLGEALPPPFELHPLGRVVYGPGSLSRLGELAVGMGQRAMLVTDPGIRAAGHPDRAAESLRAAGIDVVIFDRVQENPTTKTVAAGVEFARQHAIDLLVAVGGGSAMDTAKGTNFLLTNGGKMADYKGFGKATKPMLPSIGVPTTAGTGSEAQSYALITDESSHLKMACGDRKVAFRLSILDPELTVSQPRGVTAVTGLDALTHAIESYVCLRRNPLSQMCALTAWRYLQPNFLTVLNEPENLSARAAMQLGAHFAGMAIENAMLGAAHACANPLTAHYGVTHGVAVGIMLPHVIRLNAPVVDSLYADLAGLACLNVNGEPPGEVLARQIADLMTEAGLPTQLRECGVSQTILHLLAEEANAQWTARFNPHPVGEPELLALYEAALG
jgi:alcohol dehydrogenase